MVVFSVIPPSALGVVFVVIVLLLVVSNRSGGDLLPWDKGD